MQSGKVPLEIMNSGTHENVIMIGSENNITILLLDLSHGKATLEPVRFIEVNQGNMQDFASVENFIYSKNENNDIIEMSFPESV